MGQIIDNLIAARILWLLVKPFNKTDAFKLGIIDEKGKLLRKADELKTDEEKAAYNYLTRLVFNLKRLIAKLPGGSSMLASLIAAYFLIKEGIEHDDLSNLEEKFFALNVELNDGLCLVEEQLIVEKFLYLMEDELLEDGEGGIGVGGPPVNNTSQVAISPMPIGKITKRNNWKKKSKD